MSLPHDAEAMHTEIVLRELVSAVKDLKQIVADSRNKQTPEKERVILETFSHIDYSMETAEKALMALKERRTGIATVKVSVGNGAERDLTVKIS